MFDINKVDRKIELFIFDIYIAILKINKVASKFENVQDLLYSFTDWDSVIRDFESNIIKLINEIEADLKEELIESFIEDNKYLDFVVEKLKEINNVPFYK